MALTQATALLQLADRLDDTGTGVWSQATLRRYLNEGVREVTRRSEAMRASATSAGVAGTQAYTLAPTLGIVRMHSVYWTPTGQTSKELLSYASEEALAQIWGNQGPITQGIPSYWTTWGVGAALSLSLFPVPSTAGTITYYYYRFGAELATTTTADAALNIDVPAGWEDTVLDWAEYRCFMQVRRPDIANIVLQRFVDNLSACSQATDRYNDLPGEILNDRVDMMGWW